MQIRRQILHFLQRGLYLSGIATAYCQIKQPYGAMILMYHSIVDDKISPFIYSNYSISKSDFELQMRFLKKNCNVINLTTLLDKMENNEKISSNTAVITFDDGYLNNLEIAAPILKKYQLPATLFLCTGYISRSEPQWVDQLHSLLQFRSKDKFTDIDNTSYNLSIKSDYKTYFNLISDKLLTADADHRNKLLSSIRNQLKPDRDIPKLTMNWDDVRLLKKKYPLFELGLHSHDHLDLSALSLTQLKQELALCIDVFKKQMGYKSEHFSYPYGRHSELIALQLKNYGLMSAVITQPAQPIRNKTYKFMLPRYEVTESLLDLKLWMSGAFPMLAKRVFKRVYE